MSTPLRDVRLITIWTGTNEIMDLVIKSEFYKEFLAGKPKGRDVEADAEGAELPGEKIYNVEGEYYVSNYLPIRMSKV